MANIEKAQKESLLNNRFCRVGITQAGDLLVLSNFWS